MFTFLLILFDDAVPLFVEDVEIISEVPLDFLGLLAVPLPQGVLAFDLQLEFDLFCILADVFCEDIFALCGQNLHLLVGLLKLFLQLFDLWTEHH